MSQIINRHDFTFEKISNCFPGWAPAYPLRQVFALYDRFSGRAASATNRVIDAIDFTEGLLALNPAYLKSAPLLKERLSGIKTLNPRYLAHEYFNQEWNCMYFTDVVDAMTEAKLEYACTATPLDTIDALNLPQGAASFLSKIESELFREQMRDYFISRQFRKDLYVRGATRVTFHRIGASIFRHLGAIKTPVLNA